MRDRPSGPELLWQARRVVLDDLLGHLPEDKRYDALMVAAAMATAAHEGEAGDAPLRRAYGALSHLAGTPQATPGEPDALAECVRDRLAALAREIREGRHDADATVRDLLLGITSDRLAETNPKHLKARSDH